MGLSSEHKALFCLLRAGLWETVPDDLSLFPLTDAGWWDVYRMSVRQTVTAIVCRGLHYLPDELLPDEELMIRWVAKADRIEQRNRKMDTVVEQLARLMTDNGLHPVVMKGQGVATFYEDPLLRECGDIDLYFPSEKEERKAAGLMRKLGCDIDRQPDGSNSYCWQDVEIEHHTRLFDLYNPLLKGYLSAFIKENGFTAGQTFAVPSPLLNLVMLNAHLLKHLMGHGVGLRQFCDMARAYHALYGNYDPEKLEAAYQKTGLYKWSIQLHTFLTEHLGLRYGELPYIDTEAFTSPRLLHIVLEGGNFGQYGETKGKASQAGWERKLHTFLSFWKRRDFSGTYAPEEAFWTSVKLIIGKIK